MKPTALFGAPLRELWRRPGVQRFSRYTMGSALAFGTSQLVFLAVYGLDLASPEAASVWAFAGGIPVNYVLNRRWAWKRRGRVGVRDELVPYAAVVALSVVASAMGTAAADRWLQPVGLPRLAEVVLVAGTFAVINGGLFLAKYFLLDRLVFGDRRRRGSDDRRPHDVEPVP
jgi:putative flippase GtrA